MPSRAVTTAPQTISTTQKVAARANLGLHRALHAEPRYILSAFDTNVERLMIGVSEDGIQWEMLKTAIGSLQLYAPENGDDLRDPSIARIGDAWYIVHTSGDYGSAHIPPTSAHFGNGEAYWRIAKSADLVNWTYVASINLPGSVQSWAPEWFIDDDGSIYVFGWAQGAGNAVFVTPTNDNLTAWSAPASVGGAPSGIDLHVVKVGRWYYLTIKSGTGGTLEIYRSLNPTSGYALFKDHTFASWNDTNIEGPCLLHLGGKHWRMYYSDSGSGSGKSEIDYSDSFDDMATWSAPAQIATTEALPLGMVLAHGTIIRGALPMSANRLPVSREALPAFSAHKNGTNQTLTSSGTYYQITFGTEDFDDAGNFASSQFTAPYAGDYLLSVTISPSSLNGRFLCQLQKNGVEIRRLVDTATASSIDVAFTFTVHVRAAAGDLFSIVALASQAGLVIYGGAALTRFSGTLIR